MQEAIGWLEDEGTVSIYCEAVHSLKQPLDARTEHRKKRGFKVVCGSSTMHVTAILVANIRGACRNLGEDMKCRIYERRPLVCRIYPAEVSPLIELNTANKVCPPEAWTAPEPDETFAKHLPSLAEVSRQTDYLEAARKGLLCAQLGINTSALADEGYVRHVPPPDLLLPGLRKAFSANEQPDVARQRWTLYSPSLAETGGLEVIREKPAEANYQFLKA
jgi:Fe-S-cluster containining protein